ncbi:uncharacterized protein [Montipora capricornis]|uniref:uncharacterized protein n=1 Tax=Montipora capricornis TaxID=246305 RepID=UPI0035F21203
MADNSDISYPVKDAIDALRKAMEAGFDGLRSELDKLRYELKNDIDQIRIETQGLKQSLEFTQGDVSAMKEKAEMDLQKTNEELDTLRKRITSLELQLQTEIENNIKLEQYTRRENLRFNNIEEIEGEDCKSVIHDIIKNDLGIDSKNIKFHAVHRVGKNVEGRHQPIIARFISREDRDLIWKNRSKIKSSGNHPNSYITEDFARAILEERKILIKAMMKARNERGIHDAKVI